MDALMKTTADYKLEKEQCLFDLQKSESRNPRAGAGINRECCLVVGEEEEAKAEEEDQEEKDEDWKLTSKAKTEGYLEPKNVRPI